MSIQNNIRLQNTNNFYEKNTINLNPFKNPKEIYNTMHSIIDINELNNYIIDNSNNDKINEISDLFDFSSIINKSKKINCISLTLFCQNNKNTFPNEFESIDFNDQNTIWYKKYVIGLFKFIENFNKSKYSSSWKIRVYLENQLKSFIHKLTYYNVEIYHMKNNSIGCSPGTLWRFLVFDDKDINIAFSCDIDEIFDTYIKYIDSFLLSDKTLGRYFYNYNHSFIIDKDDIAVNYSVVLAGIIGMKVKNIDINFKSIIINYIIYKMLRSSLPNPNLEKDSDLQSIYNKPIKNNIYGYGGHWYMYGFDEKIWKHVLFPYFVEKGDVLSWSTVSSKYLIPSSKDYKLSNKHPLSIDYNYCTDYNNLFINY